MCQYRVNIKSKAAYADGSYTSYTYDSMDRLITITVLLDFFGTTISSLKLVPPDFQVYNN
ncbi:MAG: RHS repeat protein [Nitrospirae bacterium]|nr:RHS repeat protein [Nitrospirota bacterium]